MVNPKGYYTSRYSGEEIDNLLSSGVTMDQVNTAISTAISSVPSGSNFNLLDNWYFPGLINQRGITEYGPNLGNKTYAIDRWFYFRGAVSIPESGLGLDIISTGNGIDFNQAIDVDVEKAVINNPNKWTSSVLYTVGDDPTFRLISTQGLSLVNSEDGLVLVIVLDHGNYGPRFSISRIEEVNFTYRIIAAKLEMSPDQTLAVKDSEGNWMLADSPPNNALELLKCQRYYQIFSTAALRPTQAVDFRPPMRANPAFRTDEINGIMYYVADANL